MSEPERRRRRPAVSCTLCRRRKIRCNRELPCSNCVRSKNEACIYENQPPLRQQQQRQRSSELEAASSTSTSPYAPDVESLINQIKQLKEQLNKAKTSTPSLHTPSSATDSNIEEASSQIGGTIYIHHGARSLSQARTQGIRSISHKTRLFGQSHWMNYAVVLIRDNTDMLEEHMKEGTSKIMVGLQRCKRLAKAIKTQRSPSWPCPPTPDLPPRALADELVDCYLRTSETVYRVLHVPSFRRDFEALWAPGAEQDATFLVLLKLVLAMGAAAYDDNFSLRSSAIRWVYEAGAWVSSPKLKARLGVQCLQINILYLLGREAVAVGEDLVWISCGTLFRTAAYMGLHRDPSSLPPRSTFASEMHRRLWNTILELCLQSSLNQGGHPLMSLEDFDTEPPGNFDDEQLTDENPVPKPESEFTQVAVALALRKTFAARLAVTRFLNQFDSSGTYHDTLRLDGELMTSYKALRQMLQKFNSATGPSPTQFALRFVDIITQRYILSLHIPFFGPAFEQTAHAFSRKAVVDSSLKIWYASFPSSTEMSNLRQGETPSVERDDLERLVACGMGFLRTGVMQAILVVSVELRAQLEEEASLGPIPIRRDLLAVMESAKAWSEWCIAAAETNIKGHIFVCLVAASISAIMRGLSREEHMETLVKAAEEASEMGIAVMEKMLDCSAAEQAANDINNMDLNVAPELMEGWDFMMSDIPFSSLNADPMSWMFDQGNGQGSILF